MLSVYIRREKTTAGWKTKASPFYYGLQVSSAQRNVSIMEAERYCTMSAAYSLVHAFDGRTSLKGAFPRKINTSHSRIDLHFPPPRIRNSSSGVSVRTVIFSGPAGVQQRTRRAVQWCRQSVQWSGTTWIISRALFLYSSADGLHNARGRLSAARKGWTTAWYGLTAGTGCCTTFWQSCATACRGLTTAGDD